MIINPYSTTAQTRKYSNYQGSWIPTCGEGVHLELRMALRSFCGHPFFLAGPRASSLAMLATSGQTPKLPSNRSKPSQSPCPWTSTLPPSHEEGPSPPRSSWGPWLKSRRDPSKTTTLTES